MTTYASPRLTRTTLLVTISLIFFAGCYMLLIGIFHTINYVSTQKQNNGNTNITIDGEMMTFDEIRFPNCASPSVEIIFGAITFGHSMFGIVAITKEQSNLLNTYGHMLIMSCCIKFLFIVGKLCVCLINICIILPSYNKKTYIRHLQHRLECIRSHQDAIL